MNCVFCDQPVPVQCTGQIQDHCNWCGEPIEPEKYLEWCSPRCQQENLQFEEGIKE